MKDSAIKAMCYLAKQIHDLANVRIQVVTSDNPKDSCFRVDIPLLTSKSDKSSSIAWDPSGHGESVNNAAQNFLESIQGLWLVYEYEGENHKTVRKEMPAPIILII